MENYCPLPFKHVFVESRGVKPCCSYDYTEPVSISDWLQSAELAKIQSTFLKGRIPPGCRNCIESEKRNNHGTRISAIKDYKQQIFDKTDIDYIDYRSSNICNFRCRSCEPFYSNGIANEIKRNKPLQDFLSKEYSYHAILPENKSVRIDDHNDQWIIDNLHQIKRLMITGGEPTKIPSVKKIIDHIRENKITSVQLMLTSNASFTDPYWFEITKELPNIHWTLSLDAVGLAAEIIRDGTSWPVVSQNIETMFDISPSVNIGTVITNMSLFQLKPLFRFVNDLERKYSHRTNGRTQFIYFCSQPEYMTPQVLGPGMRQLALEYFKSFDQIQLQPTQSAAIDSLSKLIKNQKKPTKGRWARFKEHSNVLDQIRGQSHEWLFIPAH